VARNGNIHARFEYKYIIEPRLCSEIREFIGPFMRPDPYAAGWPKYSYPICSLYLDSPDLRLYNQVLAGEKNRFKLRVRTYSDDARTPVFFEVKRRLNQVIHKRRVMLDRDSASGLLTNEIPGPPGGLANELMPDLDEFTSCRLLISAKPVLRVRYMREAYESRTGEPIRLTFDTHLAHAVTCDASLSIWDGEWLETPVDGVILEVKFTDRFPSWARDLAQLFQLQQRSVPKYVMSLDRVLVGARSLARVKMLGGFELPLRGYQGLTHD